MSNFNKIYNMETGEEELVPLTPKELAEIAKRSAELEKERLAKQTEVADIS